MKTLYIECGMGAAGDMLMAALCELIPDPQAFIGRMNALGLPGVRLERRPSVKCGITGTHIAVTVDGMEEHEHAHDHDHVHGHDHEHTHGHDHDHAHHHHASLGDVRKILDGLDLPRSVREHAGAVYERIARAESEVHGVPVDQIHFHEVGTLDAVADVTGVCLLMDMIAPERVVVSPVHVGCGEVRCAHGVLPVPAPATARILEGVPVYGGSVRGELCTPTGAALLRHFADAFGDMPVMAVQKIGYGMGTKDFERANCVRVMLGESAGQTENTVCEIRCNLDDMTGEEIAFAAEQLFAYGALDVWCEPIQMKKNRPGTMLCCLCPPPDEERFARLIFRYTSTIGVRCQILRRYTLERTAVELREGLRGKAVFGFGVSRVKPEYEDLADIARREDLSLREATERLK